MKPFLLVSQAIDKVVLKIADWSAWVFILMMVTIVFDVVSRKLGFQIPGLGSTRLQELEWHYHVILFMLWLGANYVRDAHVRVDVAVQRCSMKTRVWLELLGILLFALPLSSVALWFAMEFAVESFRQMEGSASSSGLPYRWVIKSVLCFGLLILWFAVLSKALRCLAYLFGDPTLASRVHPIITQHGQGDISK